MLQLLHFFLVRNNVKSLNIRYDVTKMTDSNILGITYNMYTKYKLMPESKII